MRLQVKATREQPRYTNQTSVEVEEALALGAVEVVMVLHASRFVPGWLSRYLHFDEPPARYLSTDVTVDRCDSQAWYGAPGHRMRLVNGKRTARPLERQTHRLSLPRCPLQDTSLLS